MTKSLRVQGTIFCGLAMITAAFSQMLPRMEARLELIIIASLIIFLGVPHGAMDTVFAKSIYKVSGLAGWLKFGIIYAVIAASVVGMWVFLPVLFLLGFLAISVAHFSGDPAQGTHFVSRLLYGGAVIILPTVFHQTETRDLFALLAGNVAATSVTTGLSWLAWPWALAIVFAALFEMQKDPQTGFEFLAVAALALLVPPLMSFAVFFCAMHSARHILRTLDYAKDTSPLILAGMSVLPMFAVLIAVTLSLNMLSNLRFDSRIIQIIFVGLAALTVPHMALVERVRLAGWTKAILHER